MAFRDDAASAHARADELQRKVDALETENRALRANRRGGRRAAVIVAGAGAVLAIAGAVAAVTVHAAAIAVVVTGVFVAATAAMVARLLVIAGPSELVVISGRPQRAPDGSRRGYRIVQPGGRVLRVPIIERVDRFDISGFAVEVSVNGAFAKGNERVDIVASAFVHPARTEPRVANAIERFIGYDRDQLTSVARETLEGKVRAIAAALTVEQLRADRLEVARELTREAEDDFDRLGLVLDTFEIQAVDPAA